ncbi:hypothetical protein CTEN210_13172 [Chaetoceros tenuissimus]|uniref:U4/U6.U5 tri-snRNP-associated protein 1 n=1 Tax=Chaetoceros tenuissimus TaxID=426638 RepID=A0AAD3D2M9_9STRA|nr:hypothetical protein CTEN210_13172 [Chaetoceros tenuissimus]
MSEEVIELSIDETNKLRQQLGLKPLRTSSTTSNNNHSTADTSNASAQNSNDGEISLSIQESNALREKLGLPPLRSNDSSSTEKGRKPKDAIHAPAKNTREEEQVKERIEKAKLQREVQAGIQKLQQEQNSVENVDALSWADRMRTQTQKSRTSSDKRATKSKDYSSQDFEDQNLQVSHQTSDFEVGTTILTLQDQSILDNEKDGNNALENINMAETSTVQDNLKRKRMVEMGLGHAGGYAGYDDDEFEELGGSQAMVLGGSTARHHGIAGQIDKNDTNKGFKLSSNIEQEQKNGEEGHDLFAGMSGKSISLQSGGEKNVVHQSDFMSYEEEEETMNLNEELLEKRRKKKEKKVMKKLKKEKKKKKKKSKEHTDDGNEIADKTDSIANTETDNENGQGNILDELMASSKVSGNKQRKRKRRRDLESDDENETNKVAKDVQVEEGLMKERQTKFHSIMEKGNVRSKAVFNTVDNVPINDNEIEEEEDDAFLNAALSKARRLQRLREFNSQSMTQSNGNDNSEGALAVVNALKSTRDATNQKPLNNGEGGITFEIGTTKEFTRSLRFQKNVKKEEKKNNEEQNVSNTSQDQDTDNSLANEDVTMREDKSDEEDNIQTLEELAREVKDEPDETDTFEGTSASAGVGRGMSAFLGLLKQTGELGKSSCREELRGRAKDERTYEDYEKIDLKKVVKLDTTGLNGRPHEKDIELANREVKLEYRDEHGRLLTRKEAFRQLCYQFHGHGSSKRKEEKKLQQIEREQSEKSGKHSSTFGALKATQKATGKAFVLHKT